MLFGSSHCYIKKNVCAAVLSLVLFAPFNTGWSQDLVEKPAVKPVDSSFIAPDSSLIKASAQFTNHSYRLGAGDLLHLSVTPQTEYGSQDILVRSDGQASFPHLGEKMVAGRTIKEVNKELQDELNQYLKNANVVLSVASPRPVTVYLFGGVMYPGSYQLISDTRDNSYRVSNNMPLSRIDHKLSNIIANAGGVKLTADLAHVQVRSSETGDVQTLNLWQMLKNGNVEDDIWVNAGDQVTIPELPSNMAMNDEDYKLLLTSTFAPKTIPVRVIGEVHTPATIDIESRSPYLSTAITKAGGFAPQAGKTVVAVRRFSTNTQFSTMFVAVNKMDFVLRPNDVVYVGERKIYKAGRFMQQAAYALSPFQTVAVSGAATSQVFGLGGWKNRFGN